MWKQSVVFLSLASVACAAVALAPLEKKPKRFESIEGCYISELDAVIPFGKSAPFSSSCMAYQCGKDLVQYVSCGFVAAHPPCYSVSDKSKPYPDCCPTVRCENRH